MKPLPSRLGRWLAIGLIGATWATLLGVVLFFAAVYAIYADLRASDRSHFTANTGGEYLAGAIYDRFRSPWKTAPDPELIYVPVPGAQRARTPEYDVVMTITPEGVRAQPPLAADGLSELVVIAGDSFTVGLGVGDDDTYSAQLQRDYGRRTVNTGVVSYGTARELWRLRRLGLLEQASVFVIQFCSNDAEENHEFLVDPSGRFGRRDRSGTWQVVQNPYYAELSYRTTLTAVAGYLRGGIAEQGWGATLRSLWRNRRVATGGPIRVRGGRDGEALVTDFLGVLAHFPELRGKPVLVLELNDRGANTGFLAALERRAEPGIVPVPVGLVSDDFFRFDGHLKPAGHAKVAAAVDRVLRELAARPGAGGAAPSR